MFNRIDGTIVRKMHLAVLPLLAVISVASAEDFVLGINTAPKEHCNAASGICVTSVRRGGAAGRAGLQSGDVLLRLGDSAISGAGDYLSRRRNAPSNLALDAELSRAGAIIEVRVTFDAARRMAAATYVSVLVRAHLRYLPPLPHDELRALNRVVAELGAIGRNLNQIARATHQAAAATGPHRGDVLAMLKICEALRDHVKALLKENAVSWKVGYAEPIP